MRIPLVRAVCLTSALAAAALMNTESAQAQTRGLYAPGIFATNSGALPEAGLTYLTIFQFFAFDELKGPDGGTLPVALSSSVVADHNAFMWVTRHRLLGGTVAFLADVPVTTNSLTAVRFGAIAGGAGIADTFFSPFTLGWKLAHADVQAGYGLTAPTGRYHDGADDNTGAGYRGDMPMSGQTIYLTKDKTTNVSAFEAYEFHSRFKDSDVRPGQTLDVDYSLMHAFTLNSTTHNMLQLGLVGYGQFQTTDKSGTGVNPVVAANDHYRVNALGAGGTLILPSRKVTLGAKYFKEFSNESTVQGSSLQIAASITF